MNGWHLQRVELLCLRPRTWINNTVMTMIAKTLVADQLDNGGTVTRYIFSPHFMEKMIEDPMNWPLEANKAEILPDRIGYNIGDCRFIFGPSLRWDHWFCYVLDTTTMTFYALDSLVDSWTYSRIQRQMEEEIKLGTKIKNMPKKPHSFKEKERMASLVRKCFMDILRTVKPQLFEHEDRIPKGVTWSKVHVQTDVDSCGVHVVSWLQMWDATEQEDGYTMPFYSMDEIRELKIGMLWWLMLEIGIL
ncbi:hypothetical protein K1719_036691 [Acacia pycnantha]|nr:hypothetical protein K1719_036691 [Acacia pycnantha]